MRLPLRKLIVSNSEQSSLQSNGSIPSLIAALKQCSVSKDLEQGKRLHDEAKSSGSDTNVFVANSLINLYSKCGDMAQARTILDSMPCPTLVSWNTLMLGYAENRQEDLALEFLQRIEHEGGGCEADDASYVAAFKACTNLAAREDGREVDGKIVKVVALERAMDLHARALKRNGRLLQAMASRNALVDTYCKCGSVLDARLLLDRSREHNVVSWTALMMGYCEIREEELALSLFFRMQEHGLEPNSLMFLAALKACASLAAREEFQVPAGNKDKLVAKVVSLETTMLLHSLAEKKSCSDELFVATSLLQAYAKSGSLIDARRVFDRMPLHNAVAQNSLIHGYAENGEETLALDLYSRFELDRRESNATTVLAALKACNSLATKEEGKIVDGKLTKVKSLARTIAVESQARRKDVFVWNTLIDTYAKCGSMVDARRVFAKMANHSVVSWTALVLGYAESGDGNIAMDLFEKMEPGVANALTFVAALKACITLTGSSSSDRRQVLGKDGTHRSDHLRARRKQVPEEQDQEQQQQEQQLGKVKSIHARAIDAGFDGNILVASSLVDLYARCGCTDQARIVLESMSSPDTVAWNTLILGYVENDQPREALECFSRMRARCGDRYRPNPQTFVAAIKACSKMAAMERDGEIQDDEEQRLGRAMAKNSLKIGSDVHSQAAELGLDLDPSVGNSLVEFYARCGSMGDARRIFDRMISSSSSPSTLIPLIVGYAENGDADLALEIFFHRCSIDNLCCDSAPLLAAALKAGSVLADLAACKAIHSKAARSGLDEPIIVANCLIDAYGKCGSVTDARIVFDAVTLRDTVTWNSIIAAYGKLSGTDTDTALHLFRTMLFERYRADGITFVAVLAACSHGGLVDAGWRYLRDMPAVYGVPPRHEHYACTVDMLARANHLAAAAQLARHVDFGRRSSAMIWRAVLAGCSKWGNVEMGEVAYNTLVQLDARDASAFAMMANIYGSAKMWVEQFNLEVAGSKLGNSAPSMMQRD